MTAPMATSVRLSPETAQKLEMLAERTGRSKSFYLRRAVEESIDRLLWQYEVAADWEDIKEGRMATHSHSEVKKQLGLDD
ncbi:type II toxin-antitoxin system RelB family antitoxin [Corynebacterium oculi]|uniref:Relaxosome protein TraY n=1 Tax=Corynebacterium oculi TaxID=1544416 RepID=A0A0Q1A976_9CORY|nr:DUF6290 family protein [Corynebacterium oculi]KQB83320.1 Ribbon-helix-helix protein, copG family [Corynebacterium oculi]